MVGIRQRTAALVIAGCLLLGGAPVSASATTPVGALAMAATLPIPQAGSSARVPAGGVALASAAIVPGSVNRTSMSVRAVYAVHARLNVSTRAFSGSVVITATNQSGAGIDRLELNTVMPRLGGMHLGAVTVDGTTVHASVDDQTIIVPLGGVLPNGATTVVRVSWTATLRSSLTGSNWLFTRTNGIVDLYRWIPWISRRTPFDRPNHGDPFVTPVSPKVTVTIRTSVRQRWAGTGSRTAVSSDGLTQTFEATNVRDFIVAGAADYRTTSASVGTHTVTVWYRPGAPASAMLKAAVHAVSRLEALLGPYPYRMLDIVQSAGAYGMEGPGEVWIPTGVGSSNLAYLVTHEVAHQWFYGLVGSDQAREPFADEAPTDFVARYVLSMRRSSRCDPATLDRSIYRYSSACYYEKIYIQGGNVIDNARKKMGSTAFWKALRGYVSAHRFGLVHTRTLLQALDDGTPLNLRSWWGWRFPTIY